MKAVVNASPLIFLAKLEQLQVLPHPSATTPEVMEEIGRGRALGGVDVYGIEALAKAGGLVVRRASARPLPLETGLHAGEASVLRLALDLGVPEVILDDGNAIRAAKLLGLAPISTPFLLLHARREGRISAPLFRALLERLLEHRYYIAAPLYQRLLEDGGT